MNDERRKTERRAIKGPARLTLAGSPPVIVRMLDISLTGMSAVCDTNLVSNQPVKIEFNVLVRKTGQLTSLKLNGSITYSVLTNVENGFKIGLKFASPLSDQASMIILQYMEIKT